MQDKLVQPLIDNAENARAASKALESARSTYAALSDGSGDSIPALPALPSLPRALPGTEVAKGLLGFAGGLVKDAADTAQGVLVSGPASLARAGETLSKELGDAGSTLTTNVASAANGAAEAFNRRLDVLQETTPENVDLVTDFVGKATDAVVSKIPSSSAAESAYSALQATVEGTVKETQEKVGQWSFFTDKNHWENGFWEQQAKQLYSLRNQDEFQHTVDDLSESIPRVLGDVQSRFMDRLDAALEAKGIIGGGMGEAGGAGGAGDAMKGASDALAKVSSAPKGT